MQGEKRANKLGGWCDHQVPLRLKEPFNKIAVMLILFNVDKRWQKKGGKTNNMWVRCISYGKYMEKPG